MKNYWINLENINILRKNLDSIWGKIELSNEQLHSIIVDINIQINKSNKKHNEIFLWEGLIYKCNIIIMQLRSIYGYETKDRIDDYNNLKQQFRIWESLL